MGRLRSGGLVPAWTAWPGIRDRDSLSVRDRDRHSVRDRDSVRDRNRLKDSDSDRVGALGMLGVVTVALWLLAACGPNAPQPQDPVWGKQPCAHCAMVVDDRAHAAQLLTTEGDRHYYDDIGCMIAWDAERPGTAVGRWVRNAAADPKAAAPAGWLDAERTAYRTDAQTPMDFGLEAAAQGVDFAAARAKVASRLRAPAGDRHE